MDSLDAFRTTDPGHDAPDGFRLSRAIGLSSIGVGLAELAVPRTINKLLGMTPDLRHALTMRASGLVDLALGVGIVARPRRGAPMWLRVAADAIGIAALGWAITGKRSRRGRVAAGIAVSALALGVDLYASRRVTRAQEAAATHVVGAVTINESPALVYAFFRDLAALPLFMEHLESVSEDGPRSHWVAKLPAGQRLEWDAEIVDDRRGELIAWQTIDAAVAHRGKISFARAPGGDATEVRVELELSTSGMAPSALLAKLLASPQIKGDLRRLKQVIETGEVLISDASLHAGPHPAQPSAEVTPWKATCWMGKQKVELREVPDPRILNARDAIVKVTATTICGSDLHLYNGFMPAMEKGDILGHEFMGEVVELGPGVKNLAVGDRVVVPFAIACGACGQCELGNFSCCENTNPTGWMPEKLMGHATCGAFGYSHLTGGFAGGQAEYVRVPFADVGPLKVPSHLSNEQVLFLSDILPTAYMGAEFCEITPRKVIAVFGAGPVGQLAIACARMLGAERVIAIDRFPYRLQMALEKAGATDVINYAESPVLETLNELTAGRGPDACIDCVGMEAHGFGLQFAYDKIKQSTKMALDRPLAVREAILACRSAGIVSILGVYAGFMDKFPIGALMNRGITIRTGQCHVHRYMKPLLARIEAGDIDPSFVVSHHLKLDEVASGYEMFMNKRDDVMKIVMR